MPTTPVTIGLADCDSRHVEWCSVMTDPLEDFVNASAEQLRYQFPVTLHTGRLTAADFELEPLAWDSIPYGAGEIHRVPNDKRGVYAFAINCPSGVLPPHSYILYIGIAGRNSRRSLRARYRDYLNRRSLLKRERVARMVVCWGPILRFFFAPVEETVTSDDLKNIEQKLNTALMPPLSIGDLDAETKQMKRAFS